MKTILLLLLASPSFAQTRVQTQDIGGSSITWTAPATFNNGVTFSSITAVIDISGDLSGTTVTQGTFHIGVDTRTLTVTAYDPVMVCYMGDMKEDENTSFGCWSFLVDGAYINNLSATKGVTCAGAFSSSGSSHGNSTGCYAIKAGVLSAATHKFIFVPASGQGSVVTLGSGGGSITATEARFYVYKLH